MKRRGVEDDSPLEFGAFEKNTKGFGMKMLLKMGYKLGSGLGREGEGIVNPVEIKLRPRNTGLGFEEINIDIPNEKTPSVPVKSENVLKKSWKKYKGESSPLDEIIRGASQAPQNSSVTLPTKIIDFTGAQARVLASLSEIQSLNPVGPTIRFPELRYNLSLLISISEGESQKAQLSKAREDQTISQLTEEKSSIENELEKLDSQRQVLRSIQELLLEAGELAGKNFTSYYKWIRKGIELANSKNEYPEYQNLAFGAIVGVILPMFKTALTCHTLLDKEIVEMFHKFSTVGHFYSEKMITPYEQVLTLCIIPRLREKLLESLQAKPKFDEVKMQFGAHLLLVWAPLLPKSMMRDLVTVTVLPQLLQILEKWSPQADNNYSPLDCWLLPWVSSLSHFFGEDSNSHHRETFFIAIRRKLLLFLQQQADPLSEECKNVIKPWKPPMLSLGEFDLLIGRGILPQVQAILSIDLVISPASQDISPIETVLRWSEVISPEILVPLLAKNLFPKLLEALYNWMTSSTADYEEITLWYLAWKGLFPPHFLQYEPIKIGFNGILEMMNRLLEDPSIPLSVFCKFK